MARSRSRQYRHRGAHRSGLSSARSRYYFEPQTPPPGRPVGGDVVDARPRYWTDRRWFFELQARLYRQGNRPTSGRAGHRAKVVEFLAADLSDATGTVIPIDESWFADNPPRAAAFDRTRRWFLYKKYTICLYSGSESLRHKPLIFHSVSRLASLPDSNRRCRRERGAKVRSLWYSMDGGGLC